MGAGFTGAEPLKRGIRLARGISFAPVSLSHEGPAAWTLVGLLVPGDVFHAKTHSAFTVSDLIHTVKAALRSCPKLTQRAITKITFHCVSVTVNPLTCTLQALNCRYCFHSRIIKIRFIKEPKHNKAHYYFFTIIYLRPLKPAYKNVNSVYLSNK